MSDLIDRQAAIDSINAYLGLSAVSRTIQNMTSIQEILEKMPSACNETKQQATASSDCISRQDAIKYFAELWECIEAISDREEWEDVCVTTVNEIKSAQLERPKGEWIPHKSIFGGLGEKVYTCNQCGCNIGFHIENFCPNCGAEMREGEEE